MEIDSYVSIALNEAQKRAKRCAVTSAQLSKVAATHKAKKRSASHNITRLVTQICKRERVMEQEYSGVMEAHTIDHSKRHLSRFTLKPKRQKYANCKIPTSADRHCCCLLLLPFIHCLGDSLRKFKDASTLTLCKFNGRQSNGSISSSVHAFKAHSS